MSIKDKKYEKLLDPSSHINNPSFIGTIIGAADSGKIKLKTLQKLGPECMVWITLDDIVNEKEFDDGIVKIEVKKGSKILIETIREIKTGNPSLSKVKRNTDVLRLLNPRQRQMEMESEWGHREGISGSSLEEDSSGGRNESIGCSNCDWNYSTHCSGCSDNNAAQTCVRPFNPYP